MKLLTNDIELNYEQHGSGPPIILLHGNGESLRIFDSITKSLRSTHTVYALDSRNHGLSSKSEDVSYEAMSADLFQFVTKLELKNPLVLGFSDGAIIALLTELSHPGTFPKMILLGINLTPSDWKDDVFTELQQEYEKTKSPLVKLMLEQPQIDASSLTSVQSKVLLVFGSGDLFKTELHQLVHCDYRPDKPYLHHAYVPLLPYFLPYLSFQRELDCDFLLTQLGKDELLNHGNVVVVLFCILSGDDRRKTGHHLKRIPPICTDLDWNRNRTTRNAVQKEKRIPNEQDWTSS
ncbi:putative alpha/beta hydrolase [Blattamonas nauphoetae]|uniref:Alpha/beta hydrolase n=1 Tax=Blattamonas nauphoetae TaxID=2049346 RepID=A0ABQ9X5P9_9EUKA|nr:putative alpha/beta hydrolase [Blattamonas nauphoetae]